MNKTIFGAESYHFARQFYSMLWASKWFDEMTSHIHMFWVGPEHSILWCLSSSKIYWFASAYRYVGLQSWHAAMHQYLPSTLLLLRIILFRKYFIYTEKVVRQCQVVCKIRRFHIFIFSKRIAISTRLTMLLVYLHILLYSSTFLLQHVK